MYGAVFSGRRAVGGLRAIPDRYIVDRNVIEPLPAPRSVRPEVARAYAGLWKAFCSRSPAAFWRLAGSSARSRDIRDLRKWYERFFPRVEGGMVRLSVFDAVLLRSVPDAWAEADRVYATGFRVDKASWLALEPQSEMVARRLAQWHAYGKGRILERRGPRAQTDDALGRSLYRWAPGGASVLASLPSVGSAPPLRIGGATAYDPEDPWCLRVAPSGSVAWERAR